MVVGGLREEMLDRETVDRLLFKGLSYSGEKGDLIMVLGSRKACEYRVPLAAKLFGYNKADMLLFCGGKAQQTKYGFMPEFESMLAAAKELGIPSDRILIEETSLATVQNFSCSSNIIKKNLPECRKIILVTTAYHMRRALQTAKKLLPRYEFIPCPANDGSTRRDNWFMTEKGRKTALDECMKFGYYINNGLMDDFEI